VEDNVVLPESQPVAMHGPPAQNDPMGVQDALGLRRRAGGVNEIGGIVGRRRRIIGRFAFGGEPARLRRIEHETMREEPELLVAGPIEDDRRGPRILRKRQALLEGQEPRRRLDVATGIALNSAG
jgi:hypothetical protein